MMMSLYCNKPVYDGQWVTDVLYHIYEYSHIVWCKADEIGRIGSYIPYMPVCPTMPVTYQNLSPACMSHVDHESPHSHTPPPRFPGHWNVLPWKSRINTRAITYISHPPPDFQNRQRLAILEIEKQVWRVVLKFLSWIFGDLKEIFSTMWKNRANKIMKCWYHSSLLFEERKNFAVSPKCVCVKMSITWDKNHMCKNQEK